MIGYSVDKCRANCERIARAIQELQDIEDEHERWSAERALQHLYRIWETRLNRTERSAQRNAKRMARAATK